MKAKVCCFGHGWCIEYPDGKTTYVGRFAEIWPLYDKWFWGTQVQACMDNYRVRMGTEAQTRGNA